MRSRTVVFVAFDDLQLIDLAGPAEVLQGATRRGADPPYHTLVATRDGQAVRAQSKVVLAADASLGELRRSGRPIDTVVVVGGVGVDAVLGDEQLLDDVAALSRRARRTMSVCSGALLLAEAGLLDGFQATTHWAHCAELAACRGGRVEVLADRIYVRDRDRWTSAGVTAGIDLFLALVEDDHGPELAHEIARQFVVFVRRPGGQAQFSVQLAAQPARSGAIQGLLRWLPDHLGDDLSIEGLARQAGLSTRSLSRLFRAETGTTPATYVEGLRVEAARGLLETTDLTVEAIARTIGMRRVETLYQAFARRVGTTPARYREHFGRRTRMPA